MYLLISIYEIHILTASHPGNYSKKQVDKQLTEVHFSAQQIAAERRQTFGGPEEPPVPAMPPNDPPPEEEPEEQEHHGPAPSEGLLVSSSKAIQLFKHHCKVTVGSETRKFENKFYGSGALALFACEQFEKQAKATLYLFETFRRKPEERRNLLKSSGCDEKYLKSTATIATQKDALTRRICNGTISSLETKVFDEVFKHATDGLDVTGFAMTTDGGGKIKATFQGSKHTVDKTCTNFASAIDWLRSMSLGEKVRVMKK